MTFDQLAPVEPDPPPPDQLSEYPPLLAHDSTVSLAWRPPSGVDTSSEWNVRECCSVDHSLALPELEPVGLVADQLDWRDPRTLYAFQAFLPRVMYAVPELAFSKMGRQDPAEIIRGCLKSLYEIAA